MTNLYNKPQHPKIERGLVVRYRDTHDIRIVQQVETRGGARQVVRMQAEDGSTGWGAWLSTFWDEFETVGASPEKRTASIEPPHTPFCVRTSTPENPCRCWKSGSTDEED